MDKVGIYVRVSTTEQSQEGYSIPAQISTLKRYCDNYGYTIYKIYQDAGISGKNIVDRPGLLQMLEDAKLNKFDGLIIWKLSRLSRSLIDLLSIVDVLNKHNVSLVSFTEHFDTSTPIGKMLLQLLGSIAEFERNTIIENVKLGMNERFNQGLSKSSYPFGYTYNGREAILDKDKANVVMEAYKRYANGEGVTEIVDYMNSTGYKNRIGRPWRYEVVLHMLQNEFYIGNVVSGRKEWKRSKYETRPGIHPPIIDKALFDMVQKKIEANKKGSYTRNPNAEQLLSGVLLCPICGKKMYYAQSVSQGKYFTPVYRCGASNVNRQTCKGFSVSRNKVDDDFVRNLKKMLDLYSKKIKEPKIKDTTDSKLKGLEVEINRLMITRDKYFNLFESGKVDMDMFSDRINSLIDEINAKQAEKEELEKQKQKNPQTNLTQIVNMFKTFIQTFENLTTEEKREALRTFVEEVHLDSETKTITKIAFNGGILVGL